jgi:hypothetical protein
MVFAQGWGLKRGRRRQRGPRFVGPSAATARGVLAFLFAGALLATAAVGAINARAVLNLERPALSPPTPAAGGPPERRLLLIVVDGLRADVAARLPSLRELAARGARVDLTADLPTISAAQYVALLSGVPPLDSGRRTNQGLRPVGLDNVAGAVRRAGGRSAVVSDEVDWWRRLYPDDFAAAEVVAEGELVGRAKALADGGATFLVAHFCGVDAAGHDVGAASAAYARAAEAADRAVAELAAFWPGPVLVTADHGHTRKGGHGGDEPDVERSFLVAAGPGVRRAEAVGTPGRLIDVAPTAAALLGVPSPVASQGRALTSLLDLDGASRSRLDEAEGRRVRELAPGLDAGRAALRRAETRARPVRAAIAGAAFLGGALALGRPVRPALNGALAGVTAFGLGAALYWLRLGALSFSAHREFGRVLLETAGLAATAAFAVLVAAGARAPGGTAASAAPTSFLFGWLAGACPAAAAAFVYAGVLAPRASLGPAWAQAAPAIAYTGFGACVATALAALVAASLWSLARTKK